MAMMPFLLAETAPYEHLLPLYACCVGSHEQKMIERPQGFDAYQLFFSIRGSGTFHIEHYPPIKMQPGTVLMLPAKLPHRYYPDDTTEGWELGFVAFSGLHIETLLDQMNIPACTLFQLSNFQDCWQQLEALWHLISLNGKQAYWDASTRMYHLLITVVQGLALDLQNRSGAPTLTEPSDALQAALTLIHQHYHERLLLANVARAVGYSVQHFHRLFRANFGVTPQQYILQLRMRHAVQLFQDTPNITVEKAAGQLGMEASYFIRMFKRTYGTTPKQYILAKLTPPAATVMDEKKPEG